MRAQDRIPVPEGARVAVVEFVGDNAVQFGFLDEHGEPIVADTPEVESNVEPVGDDDQHELAGFLAVVLPEDDRITL